MSDYLHQLVARAQGLPGSLRPRPRSVYETSAWQVFASASAAESAAPLPVPSTPPAPSAAAHPAPANRRRTAPPPAPVSVAPAGGRTASNPALSHRSGEEALTTAPAPARTQPFAPASLGPQRAELLPASRPSTPADMAPPSPAPQRASPDPTSTPSRTAAEAVFKLETAPAFAAQAAHAPQLLVSPASALQGTERGPAQAPTVRVSIGRVELRAEFRAPPAPARPVARTAPRLSLEDYMRTRAEGTR